VQNDLIMHRFLYNDYDNDDGTGDDDGGVEWVSLMPETTATGQLSPVIACQRRRFFDQRNLCLPSGIGNRRRLPD